jgi:tRNA (cmo5U34)-methyltransferase
MTTEFLHPKAVSWTPRGEPDQLFRSERYPRRFEFNSDVAHVFDDMVHRSIPLYEQVLNSVVEWVFRFYQPETSLYDLGCSTGSTMLAIADALPEHFAIRMIGIDASAAMLSKAKEKFGEYRGPHRLDLCCTDLKSMELQPCSFVILNYTLQFLPVAKRKQLLQNIYAALVPGGMVFISEKIVSPVREFQEQFVFSYERFKRLSGYSQDEIALKKEALDQVLISFSTDEYAAMLCETGFLSSEVVMRWHNFASMVAIKR